MRTKRSSSSNMRFLKGNVLFFALLLFAIMLFVYYALQGVDSSAGDEAACRVSFAADCAPGDYKIFVDDSLLHDGAPLPADSQIVMKRYAAANSRVSLYTSKSQVKVVFAGDTVVRVLDADRTFYIATNDGKVVIDTADV